MIEVKAGDIVLARGTKWRHWLSRKLLHFYWNHVLLCRDDNEILELTLKQGVRVGDMNEYRQKQIVILRRVDAAYLDESWMRAALYNYEILDFDWVGFVLKCLQLPVGYRSGKILCDDFAQSVYAGAGVYVDFRKLMEDDLTDSSILKRYGLERIYDYRY
jgi:hypothetical protein